MIDPIVEKLHELREKEATEFNFDIDAVFSELVNKQAKSDRKIVSFVKKRANTKQIKEKKVA